MANGNMESGKEAVSDKMKIAMAVTTLVCITAIVIVVLVLVFS